MAQMLQVNFNIQHLDLGETDQVFSNLRNNNEFILMVILI